MSRLARAARPKACPGARSTQRSKTISASARPTAAPVAGRGRRGQDVGHGGPFSGRVPAGTRTGAEPTSQRPDSTVDRPVRWLVGSAPVRVPAGGTASVPVEVHTRLLAHWADGWQYEPGGYRLRVGTSAVDLPLEAPLTLGG